MQVICTGRPIVNLYQFNYLRKNGSKTTQTIEKTAFTWVSTSVSVLAFISRKFSNWHNWLRQV